MFVAVSNGSNVGMCDGRVTGVLLRRILDGSNRSLATDGTWPIGGAWFYDVVTRKLTVAS